MCSKRLIYFNVPTWSKLFFAVSSTSSVMSYFFSSFYSPYVILLEIVLLIPLKISHGKLELPTTITNIITSKPIGPYLPLF